MPHPRYTPLATYPAIAGLVLCWLLYWLEGHPGLGASTTPLPLLLLATLGWLLGWISRLGSGTLLFFAGTALVIYPFLAGWFYGQAAGGALMAFAGLVRLLAWWKQNGKKRNQPMADRYT
ncbi:MAG TPA: hypothetical protein VG870_05545 [Chitinophagaceae bacterium]|nr:hypothetical protein [Chitinophagaceae bacterium]